MTPSHYIVACFVCFGVGVYVGRDQREPPPSAIPSNMDVAALVTSEKNAKAELAAYRDLVVKVAETCRAETAH